MNLGVTFRATLDLNSEDLAIVGLALLGKLPEKLFERAKEINKQIVLARVQCHRQHMKNLTKILAEVYPEVLAEEAASAPAPRLARPTAATRTQKAANL